MSTKDSSLPEGGGEISIEKLETQLNTLKTMFAEKQKLVSDLEAYGPAGKGRGREQEEKPLKSCPKGSAPVAFPEETPAVQTEDEVGHMAVMRQHVDSLSQGINKLSFHEAGFYHLIT